MGPHRASACAHSPNLRVLVGITSILLLISFDGASSSVGQITLEQSETALSSAQHSLADPFSALDQIDEEFEGLGADETDFSGRQERLQSADEESLTPQMKEFMNNMRKLSAARSEACKGFLDEDGRIKPEFQRSKEFQGSHCLLLDGLDAVLRGRRLPPGEEVVNEGEDVRRNEGLLHILRLSRLAERTLDPSSPAFAPSAAAREVLPRLLLTAEADVIAGKLQLLRKMRTRVERVAALRSHKCVFCTTDEALSNFGGIASLPLPPRTRLTTEVEVSMREAAAEMPAFSSSTIINRLTSLFNTIAGVPIETAAHTSQTLKRLQLYNTVEAILLSLVLGAAFLFLLVCYAKGRRQSSHRQEQCSFCVLLHISAAGVLLAASFFLALRAFVQHQCEAGASEALKQTSAGPAELLPSFVGSCLSSGANGDLLKALSLRDLLSGIKLEDEVVNLPDRGDTLIYGLRTLQKSAAPWVVQPLATGKEGAYIITETNPSPSDKTLLGWLKERRRKAVRNTTTLTC
ncbi:hypothetical protein Emed_005818 [Eimeria media]